MSDLFTGKYAAFIGPAYGLTVAAFGWLIWSALAHTRRWRARYEELTRAADEAGQ